MKTVIVIVNNLGMIYKFRLELLMKLKKKYNVKVISPVEETDSFFYSEILDLGIDIREVIINRRGLNPLNEMQFFFKCYSFLKEIKPDIVMTYTIKPNIYAGIACQLLKIKYVSTVTGLGTAFQKDNILKKIAIILNKFGLKKAARIFFQNISNKDIYLNNKICLENRTALISGSGVNLERFSKPMLERSKILKFLFIGRLMKEKGIDEYLEVAKRLKKTNHKLEFYILGEFEEENYKNVIKQYEREEIIKHLGISSDPRKEIETVHCLINPSWHEGMSNVLLEAGAMKRFLIATDIPGCKEIVLNNKSGFTFEKKNINELTKCIEKFIELTGEEYRNYIENSYNHIKSNFDRNKVIESYLNVIAEELGD